MFICMVRHGETDWNAAKKLQGQTDIPLNDRGRQQAREAGLYLKKQSWDIVITSPLSRAMETANIICEQLGPIQQEVMPAFSERYFGKAEGLTKEERYRLYPASADLGEEDLEQFKTRIMNGLSQIKDEYKNAQRVLLIAHGAVINAILSTLTNGKIGTGKTRLMNACLSNLHCENDQWHVQNYNETSHLSQS